MVKVQVGNTAVDRASPLRVATELPSEYERRIRGESPIPSRSSVERSSFQASSAAHRSNSSSSRQITADYGIPLTSTTVRERYPAPQSVYVREDTGKVGASIHYRPSSRAESETFVKSTAKGSLISSGGVHINVYTEPRSMSRNSPARLSDEIEVTFGDKHRQAFTLGLGPDIHELAAGPKRVYWGGVHSSSTESPPPSVFAQQEQSAKYRSTSASRADSIFTTAASSSFQEQEQQPQQSVREALSSGSTSFGLDLDRPLSGMSTTGSSISARSVGRDSPEPTFMSTTSAGRPRSGTDASSNSPSSAGMLHFEMPHKSRGNNNNQWEIPIRLGGAQHQRAAGTSPALALSPESMWSSSSSRAHNNRRPTPIVGTTPVMAFSPDSSGSRTPLSPATHRSTSFMDDDDLDEEDVDRHSTSTTRFRDEIRLPGILRHPLGHVDVPLRIAGIPDSFTDKERKLAISGYGATRKQHAEEEYERRSPKRTMPPRNDALVRELKNKVDTIGERLPSRNGNYAINTEMLERRPFSPKKRFRPEYYMRAIPSHDDDGHPIPEWRRQFIAKQLAGYVKKEFEHDEGLEDEEYFLAKVDALLNDPEWKRKMGLIGRPDSPLVPDYRNNNVRMGTLDRMSSFAE